MTSDIALTLTQLGAVKRVTATRLGGDAGRRYKGRSGRAPDRRSTSQEWRNAFVGLKRLGPASGRPGKSLRRVPVAGRVGTRDTHALSTFSRPGVRNRA